MERVHFKYEVITMLRFTRAEVVTLSKACESHYDFAVRALSLPGVGAILNGARNILELQPKAEHVDIEVTYRQLDTLCKATESLHSPWVARTGEAALHERLHTLLKESGEEWQRLNGPHIAWNEAELVKMRKEGT